MPTCVCVWGGGANLDVAIEPRRHNLGLCTTASVHNHHTGRCLLMRCDALHELPTTQHMPDADVRSPGSHQ